MGFRAAALLALFAVVAVSAFEDIELSNTPDALEETNARDIFASWSNKHSKSYENDEEKEKRFQIFHMNMRFVTEHNAKEEETHKVGLNNLADLTIDEYRSLLGYSKNEESSTSSFKYADTVAADSVDWNAKGAVTPVKNQAQCGSCWSFSATGAIEGINKIVTGELVSVSEQELVSCDKTDSGCQGGLMDNAFNWVVSNGGINTEETYPYVSGSGHVPACDASKKATKVVTIDGHEDVPRGSESALKKAVTGQPVSVAIEADQQAFQLYTSGIFSSRCGTQLDHGVLAVGYGDGYWLVKNSWGSSWGDSGYIKMATGVSGGGQCGIALQASYPTKSGGPGPSPGPPSPGPGPSPPGPVQCNAATTCPAGNTCCCAIEIFGMCLEYGCCPLPDASCCDDHIHCCPGDHPVCNVAAGTCGDSAGNTVAISKKTKGAKVDLFDRVVKQIGL